MSGRSQFFGALRAIGGLSGLTMRELMRTGAAPISFFLYILFLLTFSASDGLELGAASARFVDHGLGGVAVMTMFLALFFGMQLAERGEDVARSAYLLRRTVGPASFFWGRLLGMSLMLVLFGLLAGALVVLHHGVRFAGAEEEFRLESRQESDEFSSRREVKFMRERGDRVGISFELDTDDLAHEGGRGVLSGRFAPTLVLMSETGEARADCPVKLTISDADSGWHARRILRLHEGRAERFQFDVPMKNRPKKILLTLENRSKSYLVKFRQADLQLITETKSHAGGIMRGALALSLLASVLASFALFLRENMSFGPSLITAFGIAVLSFSVEVLEFGVLAGASADFREAIVSGVTTLLPDAGSFDVIQRLARGRDVGWDVAGELTFRFLMGAIFLGVLDGWVANRRALA